nr:putative capsid [Marmot picobirnavirus]
MKRSAKQKNSNYENCASSGRKPEQKVDAAASSKKTQQNSKRRTQGRNNFPYASNSSRTADAPDRYRNDPHWYYVNPTITDNALRINFEEFVGKRYQVGSSSYMDPLNVLVYFTAPTPNRSVPGGPYEEELVDPGALWAARKLYSALSSVTGRTSQYTPSTLCFMTFALGEMLSMYSFIRRVFGYYRTYNRRNWGIPTSLLTAMSVNATDFKANIANYLTEFNTIIVDINKLPILSSQTYLQKCVAMYDSVFADMDADMAQLFLLAPAYTWYLREDGSSVYSNASGTVLQTIPVCISQSGNVLTQNLSVYLEILRQQVRYLLESSTLNIVYADILNYAAKNNLSTLVIPQIGLDYNVPIAFNASVNQQMHHAMVAGLPLVPSAPTDVAANGLFSTNAREASGQDTVIYSTPFNDIIEQPSYNSYVYSPCFKPYIPFSGLTDITETYWDSAVMQALLYDADVMDESLDQRVDNTRYMLSRYRILISPSGESVPYFLNYTASGDHSVVAGSILTPGDTNLDSFARSRLPAAFTVAGITTMVRLNALNLPPLTWVFHQKLIGSETGLELSGPIGDLKNVTFLSPAMLLAANKLIERDLFDVRDLRGFSG